MADRNRNPNNPQSELFRRLTRLFSGPIVNWRTQMNRKIRRTALDKYATQFKSASGQQFKRAEYSPFDVTHTKIMANQNRAERYTDYEQMEYMPEIASSLDIYADEMTTHSALTPMLEIHCPNEEIKAVLNSLYTNVLNTTQGISSAQADTHSSLLFCANPRETCIGIVDGLIVICLTHSLIVLLISLFVFKIQSRWVSFNVYFVVLKRRLAYSYDLVKPSGLTILRLHKGGSI